MAENVGRYVYVIDRKEVAPDRRDGIWDFAEAARTTPQVFEVFGDDDQPGTVARRIEDVAKQYGAERHVILIITHAGMKMDVNWWLFRDWDAALIDEIPSVLNHESHHTCAFEKPSLSAFYDLIPTDIPGESAITFKGGFNGGQVGRSSPQWLKFHQRVLTGEARCDLVSWDDLDQRSEWSSWTIWDARDLAVFKDVRFLGDSFTDTDTYHLMHRSDLFEFDKFSVADGPRHWAQRPVTILYVSEEERAGSTKLKDERNAAELRKIGAWLAKVGASDHIWTCNGADKIQKALKAAKIPGEHLTPKQAGSNKHMAKHHASMIYAAKPSPQERRFFGHLGIDPEVITTSRETYDIRQFFMRTSLRDPTSTAPVELRVLDKWQAEAFAAYLTNAYGLSPEVVFEDIGLSFERKKVGRPANDDGLTPEEKLAKKRKQAADRQKEFRKREKEKKAA